MPKSSSAEIAVEEANTVKIKLSKLMNNLRNLTKSCEDASVIIKQRREIAQELTTVIGEVNAAIKKK